jgi:hypothetical protein
VSVSNWNKDNNVQLLKLAGETLTHGSKLSAQERQTEMATVAPCPIDANLVRSELFPLQGVRAVFIKRGSPGKFRLSIFVETKDRELEQAIIAALGRVADLSPETPFDYSVILRNGRSLDEIISNPGESLFARVA